MEYQVQVIRSRRRIVSLEIREAGVLTVRVPQRMNDAEIGEELERHRAWIDAHMQKAAQRERESAPAQKFSREELEAMAQEALRVIPPKAARYAAELGVTFGRITIRNQRTRWGSCSAKGNLNFNCLLMRVPEPVLDYVIVHELCHRREMNHSPRFWSLVGTVLPDYQKRRGWLRENGGALIGRL